MTSHILTAKTLAFRPLNNSAMADRQDAQDAYTDHALGFDGATYGAIEADLIFLDGLGMQLARLVKSTVQLPDHARFVDAKPDRSVLAEQLCDVIEDALGPHAGRVVRAYVRGEG